MMLINQTRDFYVKAVMHAKQGRLSELNHLEAELMMLEDLLIKIMDKVPSAVAGTYHSKISELKLIIKNKKKEFL